jgi:hypothetical protein
MVEKSKQIKTKLALVVAILTAQPETRDSDRELVAAYWRAEQPLIINFGSADKLLRAYINGELSNPDDITRTRRLVQAKAPELRGTLWKTKQRYQQEAEVRENIDKVLGGDLYKTAFEPACQHPADKQQPYHDGAVICTACNCIISQFGNKFNPPVKLSQMP